MAIRTILIAATAAGLLFCAKRCFAQTYQVRDSAGISVVLTGGDLPNSSWSVGDAPIVTIGKVDGEEPYLFSQIWDALRTPDGRIVVVEGSSCEIRIFGPDGGHQLSFGGRGGGPEEFGSQPWIALSGSDTLIVWDPGHRRLSKYNLDGRLLGQAIVGSRLDSLGIRSFGAGLVWQIDGEGTLLWAGPGSRRSLARHVSETTKRVLLLPASTAGALDLGEYAGDQTYYTERSGGGISGMVSPFGPSQVVALGAAQNRVAISDAGRWEVRVLDGVGKQAKIWRLRFPRVPTTPEKVAAAHHEFTDLAERLGLTRKQADDLFTSIPVPDSVPAIGALFWDTTGDLWIGSREGMRTQIADYHVLDGTGRWLSTVRMPGAIDRLFEVGEDYVLAESQDEFDVRYVQLYRLRRQ